MRMFLTRGALSKECAELPSTCNICSSRMSPVPYPHTSGNMWLARCDYVSKLIEPNRFATAMDLAMEKIRTSEVGNLSKIDYCRGSRRYSAEHWIHSHPAARPCDLHTDPAYAWNYNLLPKGDFVKELKSAPRYPLAKYVRIGHCGKNGQLLQERLVEYQFLYNTTPTAPWWGWEFFGHPTVANHTT